MRPPRPERHGGHRRSLVAHLPAFLLGAAVATAVLKLAGPALPALPATLESMRGTEAGSSPQERSESFKVLESVRGSPLLFVTFSNAAYFNFLHNWALSVERLGIPYFIAAFDAETADLCAKHKLVHGSLTEADVGASSFRNNLTAFRGMGALKVSLVTALIEDFGVETLVVSDTDTVWLRNPTPYLEDHPIADWFISTDCLSHSTEELQLPRNNNPRCGHIAGNVWGRALNSGVFVLRNRPPVKKALHRWHQILTDPSQAIHTWRNNFTSVITDQLALNLLLDEGMKGDIVEVPGEERTIYQANSTIKLHPLPVLLFPGGHIAFVQRVPWVQGVEPYVVHATFQRFSFNYQPSGKRGRFREFGLWLLDPPGYYRGRFLSYDNNVLEFVHSVVKQHGGLMPVFYKHWLAVSYQYALFTEALALAAATNRTVVLPQSWCWCDYDHVPHVMETCKVRGSDLDVPFLCPADFVFHIAFMDSYPSLAFRMPNFLELPQIPKDVNSSRAVARVVPTKPAALPAVDGEEAVVWLGISEVDLLQQLQGVNDKAILQLQDMRPRLVRDFTDPRQAKRFDAMMNRISAEWWWCCSGVRMEVEKMSFRYDWPRRFSEPYAPYEIPILPLPPYCPPGAKPNVTAENMEYVNYPNHPCMFLRNAASWETASALA